MSKKVRGSDVCVGNSSESKVGAMLKTCTTCMVSFLLLGPNRKKGKEKRKLMQVVN